MVGFVAAIVGGGIVGVGLVLAVPDLQIWYSGVITFGVATIAAGVHWMLDS